MSLMYFTGKKASSHVRITDPTLPMGYVELEMRMCAHCGFHGIYNPGNAKQYLQYMSTKNFINGVCYSCQGLTCMRDECNTRCEVLEARIEREERVKVIK